MKKKMHIRFFCVLIISCLYGNVDAYSPNFHREITRNVINQNADNLNKYFRNLGLSGGILESVGAKTVRQWIEDGSKNEDYNWNVRNNPLHSHFYEPISNTAGVGDIPPSDYDWANAYNNYYSWKEARNSLFYGLTFKIKYEREVNLAKAFEAIGHIVHLVEDMAVPAHTRGDLHASIFGGLGFGKDLYEEYTDKIGILNYPSFYFPYWNVSISSGAPKQFWDLDSYDGSIPYYAGYIGLAEYTNANFFSKDTIFENFPHPAKENTTAKLVEQTAKDGKTDKTWYIQGYTSERLAAYSYMMKYMIPILPSINIPVMGWLYNLDTYVHEDYASQLIPRAVGYSAGLLDYFFRGNIGIERDQNAPDELVVMNLSAEQMNGSFGLYYDDATDYRRSVTSWGLDIPAYSPKYVPLSYCILKDLKPEPKEKGKYILAFQGTMGNEAGAVVANANINLLSSSCEKALTITGPDTVSQDNSTQLEVSGCTGCADDVAWTASGTSASIDKNGLLTVNKTACGGTATITAKCPDCKTEISKTITIPDPITISDPDSSNCYTASGGAGSYTWDISKGSIDPNGCVSATTGQCGITTITITDANGCKTTKTVTLPDTLTITGPDAPHDGDCYTATGGTEPYTWDITKGKIDVTKGCVKELTDLCGPATVKAKDVNECAGKKEVNIPAVPLDISGANMIAKNSSETYSANGCSKTVNWSVAGKGATIEPLENAGALLKTDETACREITVTAKCPDCNTEASKNVSVSDTCGTLTISGPDTTVKNSTTQPYTASGCCENVKWSVTGKGATITPEGILKTDGTACGAVNITASCSSCSTTATKEVLVSDAGQWVHIPALDCKGCARGFCAECPGTQKCPSWTNCGSIIGYIGKYRYIEYWYNDPPPNCGDYCGCASHTTPTPSCDAVVFNSYVYEWQCP